MLCCTWWGCWGVLCSWTPWSWWPLPCQHIVWAYDSVILCLFALFHGWKNQSLKLISCCIRQNIQYSTSLAINILFPLSGTGTFLLSCIKDTGTCTWMQDYFLRLISHVPKSSLLNKDYTNRDTPRSAFKPFNTICKHRPLVLLVWMAAAGRVVLCWTPRHVQEFAVTLLAWGTARKMWCQWWEDIHSLPRALRHCHCRVRADDHKPALWAAIWLQFSLKTYIEF